MMSISVHQSHMPPFLARFFHRFPHLNVTGHKVNSTFDYNNQVYLESLGILASFPALILILILVVLLIYLLTRCCDRHAKRDRSFVCLKIILGLLGMATCASIGLGLYGNDDFHNGIETVVTSLKNIQLYFVVVSNQTLQAQASIERGVFPLMSQLGVVFERPLANKSMHVELLAHMQYMEGNITQTLEQISILNANTGQVGKHVGAHNIIQLIESIRWPSTLTVLIIFIIFCVVLFYAIVRHSRCCFITFSVLGLIAVILNWSLVSLYLVGTVSLADICINPNRAATSELLNGGISTEISDFYINCQSLHRETDPFKDNLLQAQKSIEKAQDTLKQINTIATALYSYNREKVETVIDGLFTELYHLENIVGDISTRTDCQPINGHWMKGVEGLCTVTLYGLSFLLLSSVITAFLFTLLVGLDSHTWIYIQKRKQCMNDGAEECVSFLPSGYGDRNTTGTGRRTGGAGLNPYLINQTTHDWSCSSALMEHEPTPLNGTRQIEYGSHHHHQGRMYEAGAMGHTLLGPNNGQYATLSKQCKTLESNDFY
ncbi:unnamed protein product [Allacma fusca]|uniref:Protein tweety homolog n=1 Tax=Allacma fusca TaxID=39272 RepID=A0A8J2P2S0_9HEXA|nr:unnamed protein product [Allacma fusca]